METHLLEGTIWNKFYNFFGVSNDADLCSRMATILSIFTCLTGLQNWFAPAAYGRYSNSDQNSLASRTAVDVRLGFGLGTLPSFLLPILVVLTTPHPHLSNVPNAAAFSLFLLHYFNRALVYPFTLSKGSRYPLVNLIWGPIFCAFDGFLQGFHLTNAHRIEWSGRVSFGVPLFLLGLAINISHDRMLTNLRKNRGKSSDGKPEYQIPRGGLFEYISGANYFGELVEWWALAMMTQGYPQVAFAVFSTMFIGVRACQHHRFYKTKFGDTYPANRKAIIPFLL